MCYDDGTRGSAQRQVCGTDRAPLLDCRHDDYFSTSAPAGSYLQAHWNAARSSYLDDGTPKPSTTASPGVVPSVSPTSTPPGGSPVPAAVARRVPSLRPLLPVPSPLSELSVSSPGSQRIPGVRAG